MANRAIRMVNDDALIDAILAAPDDDGPRLVYADALTERGDPLGELIVLQCRRGRPTRAHVARERTLANERGNLLRAAFPDAHIELDRGFIGRTNITPPVLRTRWAQLVRQPLHTIALSYGSVTDVAFAATHPTVKTVEIVSQRKDYFCRGSLDAKALRERRHDDAAEVWTGSLPHEHVLPALRRLELVSPNETTIERVCALPNLVDLSVSGFDVSSLWLPQIRHLELRLPGSLSSLTMLPQLESFRTPMALDLDLAPATSLRALGVESEPVRGFAKLLAGPTIQQLERILIHSGIYPATAAGPPPEFPILPKLREVELVRFAIDDDAARALVCNLVHVETLDARLSSFTGRAREILLEQWPAARFAR